MCFALHWQIHHVRQKQPQTPSICQVFLLPSFSKTLSGTLLRESLSAVSISLKSSSSSKESLTLSCFLFRNSSLSLVLLSPYLPRLTFRTSLMHLSPSQCPPILLATTTSFLFPCPLFLLLLLLPPKTRTPW
ncbi:hypothetical protein CRV24_003844 [Beauveria bassiana]|nr:hypothetical protein CRV24_003844 [Beauveria bassiana]